jgi:NitT/TauT family transport system substrate-binding protein
LGDFLGQIGNDHGPVTHAIRYDSKVNTVFLLPILKPVTRQSKLVSYFPRLAVVALLALSLSACDIDTERPLRVGLLVWPGYEFAFLAREQGAYSESIELVDYLSPAEAVRDFRDGSLDAVALTANYALDFASYDSEVRIVLLIDESNGGDSVIARPEYQTLADLRGQRVGVEASALGAYMLARSLESAVMTADDIEVVPVDLGDQEALFRRGELAAVTTYEPTRSRLLAEGGIELFNSNQLEHEVIDMLITRESVIEQQEDSLRQLVTGWLDAIEFYQRDRQAAAQIMAPRERIAASELLELLENELRLFDREDNEALMKEGGDFEEWMTKIRDASLRAGLIEKEVDVQQLIDDRFIPESVP